MTGTEIRWGFTFCSLAILTTFFSSQASSQTIQSNWKGVVGNWSQSTNWTPSTSAPNNTSSAQYQATVSAGTAYVDVPVELSRLIMQSGVIDLDGINQTGAKPQTLRTSSMLMNGGAITGSGKLIIDGDLDIRSGSINNSSGDDDSFEVGGDIYKRGYGKAVLASFDRDGDYGIYIERGKLAYGNGGLGASAGGIFVTSPEFARLQMGDPGGGVPDDVYLNNGRGFNGTGALVSVGPGFSIAGKLFLGDVGAVVGLLPGNSSTESMSLGTSIHGGTLEVVGQGAVGTSGGDHTYSGATRVGMDGAYTEFGLGDNGRLPSTSAIELGGNALLRFNQFQSGIDRIADAIPITLHGGSIAARGVQLGTLPSVPSPLLSEQLGSLKLARGASNVSIDREVAGLEFASLQRLGAATINFDSVTGSGLPSPYLRIGFDEAPALKNSIVGAWATVNGIDFATYDAVTGVQPLGNKVARPAQVNNANSNSHVFVDLGADLATLNSETSIATLAIVTEGTRDLNLGGHTLTLRDGGLIRSGGSSPNTLVHNGQLTAGDTAEPTPLHLHTKWRAVTPRPEGIRISADIVDNTAGGVVSLVKSGNFEVALSGNNTYSGPTVIQESSLIFASEGALPSGGDLTVESGEARLNYTPTSVKTLERLTVTQGGWISAPSTSTGTSPRTSQIVLDADEYLLESGRIDISIAGDGTMRKRSAGLVELRNDNSDYTGAIVIEQGTLVAGSNSVVRAPRALGQGEAEVRTGGTLIHGSTGASAFMRLDADLNLAGGDVGIWRPITTNRWDFEGDWRVTEPSRLLTFDPTGREELGAVTVNVQGRVALHDHAGLSVLGDGSVQFLGGVAVDGEAFINADDGQVLIAAINSSATGGSLRLDGGHFQLPAAWNSAPGAGDLTVEIGAAATASLFGTLALGSDEQLIVNGAIASNAPVELTGGKLQGVGFLNSVSNSQGEVAPGNSVGTITISDYLQDADGLLTMEVLGGGGGLSDQLRSTTATLGGSLKVNLAPGADLEPGDVFNLVVATQLTIDNLQLFTEGFSADIGVVTLLNGPDAGMQALQLYVIPEPTAGMLLLAALSACAFGKHRKV